MNQKIRRKTANKIKKVKKIGKKIWWFIWEDDSWLSWIVNVILAFVIIKFLVYPGLGLFLNTSHPIVAVVSGSMEHDTGFDEWWSSPAQCEKDSCTQGEHYAEYGITKKEFLEYNYKNGFDKGDIMIIYGKRPEKIEKGDVIVYHAGKSNPIIHRVVDVQKQDKLYFSTKGDHNPTSMGFEKSITKEIVIGEAVMRIPYLGYIKIWFVDLLKILKII